MPDRDGAMEFLDFCSAFSVGVNGVERMGWVRHMMAGAVRYRCTYRHGLLNKRRRNSVSGMVRLEGSDRHRHFTARR